MITIPKSPLEILKTKEFWTFVQSSLTDYEFEIIQLRFLELRSLRWLSKHYALGGRPQAKKLIDIILEKLKKKLNDV